MRRIAGFAIESDIGERNAEYVGYRLFLLLTDPGSDLVAGCRGRQDGPFGR